MHVVADFNMANNSHATRQRTVRSDDCTACNTGTTRNGRIRADTTVVPDVHLVVNDHTIVDRRVVQGASIDCCTCADKNPVSNHQSAERLYLDPTLCISSETKAIGTEHRVRLHNTVVTDAHAAADDRPGANHAARSDEGALLYYRTGVDNRTRIHSGRFRYRSFRVNTARTRLNKQPGGVREREVGILRLYVVRRTLVGMCRTENDGARGGRLQRLQVGIAGEKAKLFGTGVDEWSEPFQGPRSVPGEAKTQSIRYFTEVVHRLTWQ